MGYRVCHRDDLKPGDVKIVSVGHVSIGVFNVDGRYYALRNRCAHRGAELCRGTVSGTFLPSRLGEYRYGLEGRILRCPWHRWEYDLETGRTMHDPERRRVKTYRVHVRDEHIELDIDEGPGTKSALDEGGEPPFSE